MYRKVRTAAQEPFRAILVMGLILEGSRRTRSQQGARGRGGDV
jgi:hypothetical protein